MTEKKTKPKSAKQPEFPLAFNGYNVCWGLGNDLVGPQLLASIPMFTLYKEGSRKRKRAEKEYWKIKQKEYEEARAVYEKNVFVGTVFYGSRKEISGKVTKIVADDDKQYVCWKASDECVDYISKQNRKNKTELRPPKPGRVSLTSFISAIKNGTIKIISCAPKK